ncbi:hypothetical protein HPB51_026798 [Rhipicephalus microplus]|uniref:Uncharacterized protein n=1 Tax=Rhipicephalus microplus TaxID=6941 RepID=A0A9J6D208_RHIMP|nr:hypothetical protein HPB51_026798 [Rhipicephalus microplus]
MPKRKRPAEDQGWGGRDPRPISVSDSGCEGSFSYSTINNQTLCTSSEGRPCRIFRNLASWNKFFWRARLELRENYPGQLSLVQVEPTRVAPLVRGHEAATLLHCLLFYHRCLVSVVLNDYVCHDHQQMIGDALSKSPVLRKLEVRLLLTSVRAYKSLSIALPRLNHLEELYCKVARLEQGICVGLSKLLVRTTSLTTLKLSARHLSTAGDVVILDGLKRNRTVTPLSLCRRASLVLCRCGVEFADYLRENQKLRRLALKSHSRNDNIVPTLVIRSLFSPSTISEVTIVNFLLSNENSRLVAEMLGENRLLRAFHMVKCYLYEGSRSPESDGWSDRISPRITALAKNATLERLTMDLSCFSLEECRSLFKTFASHKYLKSITVDRLTALAEIEIRQVLRETGVLECFTLPKPHDIDRGVVTLRDCKELSSIRVVHTSFNGLSPLPSALTVLPSCSHVTSLFLLLYERLDSDTISLLVEYIAGTTVLRNLEMKQIYDTLSTEDRVERALVQALSINKSIRKLSLEYIDFNDTEAQMLVDKLQATRTLCELFLKPGNHVWPASFLQKLSPIIASNYTLICLKFKSIWLHEGAFAVSSAVSRNWSLVTRVAHFVTGTRHRYCAAALELVHWNPGVVAKVQELSSVDENEAVSRIQNSLKSFSELDDFMRLAGVVKWGVTCGTRDDCQLQLTDLNRDCWLHIRKYLTVGDILDVS